MKSIEEIKRMDLASLEKIAADSTVMVPPSLKRDIRITARALELAGDGSLKKKTGPVAYASASIAAAAVAALVLAFGFSGPKDTFQDPELAYAQLEQTFNMIGSRMNSGMELAQTAQPILDNTITKALK